MDLTSTIAAISTPYGTGGISIIRISGSDAIAITDRIFKASSKKVLSSCQSHTIHHGRIVSSGGKVLDEVLVSVMKAPKTFTGEDICEINCHGGLIVTKAILEETLKAGAVLADRGEFTKRAFLNGKMDLCKAEAVIDIITSKTALEQEISVNHLGGALSDKINTVRERLIALCANIQVLIDYPDEGLEDFTDAQFEHELRDICSEINSLLSSSNAGLLLRSGIPVAIVGKPNVGKSSLLNLLSGVEKAIVTDVEGTTRDAIEEYVNLGDITLRLADTAGIRDTEDKVEAIGVEKSKEYIKNSDLIIFMADSEKPLDQTDDIIIKSIGDKKRIALINKCDSGNRVKSDDLKNHFEHVIEFSVKTEKGVAELESCIKKMYEMGDISCDGSPIITNARHRDALLKAKTALDSAVNTIEMQIPPDTTFIDLEEAISCLGEIVGLTVSEEIVDRIFHKFCIGK
ncbi:MAG: tRNA uridine-5-carboxymethylaminomethyl(34) synthesis GTPase MnmE [Clostridia bacterium]|nr:tRNA uridine-5-carboxymethylaminomethyl(34) synthesis GTPase MnmE [Clostridia bacterium]